MSKIEEHILSQQHQRQQQTQQQTEIIEAIRIHREEIERLRKRINQLETRNRQGFRLFNR